MKRKVKQFAAVVFSLPLLAGCTYNPFIADNNTTGSPVGAAIGAGVGAGLGVAGALFSKGHEAVVKSGTEFGVILNQTVSLPTANVR